MTSSCRTRCLAARAPQHLTLAALVALALLQQPTEARQLDLQGHLASVAVIDRPWPALASFASRTLDNTELFVRQLEEAGEHGPAGWACSQPSPAEASAEIDGSSTSAVNGSSWSCTSPLTEAPSTCMLTTDAETSEVVWVCAPDNECAAIVDSEWDLRLHLIAIFVVLAASFIGCAIPLLALPFITLKWPRRILFVLRHFGTGVFLSTAFVHLLYESFTDFANPCIGGVLFEPAAPAIALGSLLFIFCIDFSLARFLRTRAVARSRARQAALAADASGDQVQNGRSPDSGDTDAPAPIALAIGQDVEAEDDDEIIHFCPSSAPPPVHTDSSTPSPRSDTPSSSTPEKPAEKTTRSADIEAQRLLTEEREDEARKQAKVDVYLLEGGVVFHSVMIGVALGAGSGTSWLSFFIAICAHQCFEGLGLGSRIALLQWAPGQGWRKWMLATIFGLITPLGMAIGMALQSSFNPNSATALLSVAVLNSISAGILLYAGVVELLVADFLHGELRRAPWSKVGGAMASLLAGAGAMSAVGKWA